jgi:hypothetical protein
VLNSVFSQTVRRATVALWLVGAVVCVATALRAATYSLVAFTVLVWAIHGRRR